MAANVSLDFANTTEHHGVSDTDDKFASYTKAVEWARRQGILTESHARRLLDGAAAHPEKAAEALRRITSFREAVFRLLSAVAHQRVPAATDLEMLNSELVEASGHLRLILAPGGGDAEDVGVTGFPARPRFDWEWSGLGDSLTSLLWPVARATAELLSSRQKSQLRECAGDSCEWLFLDLSKNASRRWCDMSACGNRAKAKRYRARKTEGNSAPPAAG